MQKVTLRIENSYERRDHVLGEEVTIGRTEHSTLVIADQGLSRRNTTIFRDEDAVWVVDEGSLNGTFLNGERVEGRPRQLKHGDDLRIGSYTRVVVHFEEDDAETRRRDDAGTGSPPYEGGVAVASADGVVLSGTNVTDRVQNKATHTASSKPNWILIAAGLMTFAIIFLSLIAYLVASRWQGGSGDNKSSRIERAVRSSAIPVRVVDPLGGEDEDDLDDLIASWEVPEEEIKAENVADVKVDSADTADADLNVTAALLADRQKKALEPRNGETGIRPAGLDVPKELFGDGVIKQKAKLREMNTKGYRQPMDFAELADKRMRKELIEMPMATKSFYLDVGGSAPDGPFQSFSFQGGDVDIQAGSPKFQILSQLAGNFSGQHYDLNNAADRKQMRMRLLRMFNPRAKPILQELADAYFGRFGRPLRVTSLTRSMDYQILLNRGNPNSFKVRGEGSLPPHTSGCAFDLARKHMTAEEQNFVMQKLAEMEDAGKLDALIEYGVNACFHIFIYDDGVVPRT